jgi:hypothetical protein
MKKRGSGHFEMVMAFTFFVGFTFFLFMSLRTDNNSTLFDSVLDNMGDDFFDLVKVDFGSVFVSADYDKAKSCFYFNLSENIFDFSYSGKGLVVEDLDGNIVSSGFVPGFLSISSREDYFRIKFSEEFLLGSLSGCDLADSYELGSVVEKEVVSYTKLINLEDRYFSDYDGLRNDLSIPAIYDFGIVIDEYDIEMLPSRGVSNAVEVLAQNEVFEVLREDGSISNVKVNFRIW